MRADNYVHAHTSNNEKQPTHLKISISKVHKKPLFQSLGSTNDCLQSSNNLNPNNVNLQSAYNRMIRIRNTFTRLDLMAQKRISLLINYDDYYFKRMGYNKPNQRRDTISRSCQPKKPRKLSVKNIK